MLDSSYSDVLANNSNVLITALRSAATAAMRARFDAIDAASVWRDLVEGRSRVVDQFSHQGWLSMVLEEGLPPPARSIPSRSLEILEEVLLGTEPKVVSIDRALSPSTVSASLKVAFRALGLECRPSRVPLLFVTLVHAAKERIRFATGRSASFEHEGRSLRVLSMPAPEQLFARLLTPAEQVVMSMRLHGKSHAEIAASRRTSLRTVANQVAAAFHRLGVSRRSDLMELVIAPTLSSGTATGPSLDVHLSVS